MKLKSLLSLKIFLNLKIFLLSFFLLSPVSVFAAGFSAGISPPKFELKAKPGEVIRDTITILNATGKAAGYKFRTADWNINDKQGVDFIEDKLAENSCRPWVRLERKFIKIRAGSQKKYRFEIHTPEDAQIGLCKFAILVEPDEKTIAGTGEDQAIKFPVVGRYAVIVYLTIGKAKADIEYFGLGERQVNNLLLPTLKFHNKGDTYGRAFGDVTATDANGKRHVLVISSFPVLPGRTEEILLSPDQSQTPGQKVEFSYPLQLKGKIEMGGKTFKIDESFQ